MTKRQAKNKEILLNLGFVEHKSNAGEKWLQLNANGFILSIDDAGDFILEREGGSCSGLKIQIEDHYDFENLIGWVKQEIKNKELTTKLKTLFKPVGSDSDLTEKEFLIYDTYNKAISDAIEVVAV